jgi:hypothetical protein
MVAILFLFLAAIELVLLARAVRAPDGARAPWLMLLLFTAAAIFGNLLFSLGGLAGLTGQSLMQQLHQARIVLQAACAPLLIPVMHACVVRSGLEWAGKPAVRAGAWAAGFLLLAVQCGSLAGRSLVAASFGGLAFYRETGFSELRTPLLLTQAFLIACGLLLYRRTGRPWAALGAIALFAGAATPVAFGGPLVLALAELSLLLSLQAALTTN